MEVRRIPDDRDSDCAILIAMASSSQPQAINLADLDVAQLSDVKRQLEEVCIYIPSQRCCGIPTNFHWQELNHLTNSFAQLKQAQAKFKTCIENVGELQPRNASESVLCSWDDRSLDVSARQDGAGTFDQLSVCSWQALGSETRYRRRWDRLFRQEGETHLRTLWGLTMSIIPSRHDPKRSNTTKPRSITSVRILRPCKTPFRRSRIMWALWSMYYKPKCRRMQLLLLVLAPKNHDQSLVTCDFSWVNG